ncbi:MAG: PIG-L family deacetylase [Deltaproteobacteria bacterium]|nr:PIG-L family deacetylase [Deltaproteobacteria bacterium]
MLAAYTIMLSLSGLVVALVAAPLSSQSAPEIARAFDRLGSVGTVLYVAAHPDDENTRLLTWLVRDRHVRAAYLSITRGEGGQNLIGSEQGALLGVIRSQELLAARAIDGAEQYFTSMKDFGYSKSAKETLAIWDKDRALADVVGVIRRVRPDVIITRFSPEPSETHGHHTASAILALEAFTAAADPKKFPQHKGAWQARRIVWNKGIFGDVKPETIQGFAAIDVGGFDPVLGKTYSEIAAESRSMHKSQGFGAAPQVTAVTEYFKLLGGEAFERSPLDGIDWTWARLDGANVQALADAARAALDLRAPEKSVRALLAIYDAVHALRESPERALKLAEITELIGACASLDIAVLSQAPTLVAGAAMKARITTTQRSRTAPAATLVSPPAIDCAGPEEIEVVVAIDKRELRFRRPALFVRTDPTAGVVEEPIALVPPVTAALRDPLLVFAGAAAKSLVVTVRSSEGAVSGTIALEGPSGFAPSPKALPFSLATTGAEQTLAFSLTPPKQVASGRLTLAITTGKQTQPAQTLTRLAYPHIRPQTILAPAEAALVRLELRIDGSRIGYIAGAGDDVPNALRQVGYDVRPVDLDGALDGFDAIVTGVRAFNTTPRLAAFLPRLLAWAEAGGTVVVQYNTNSRLAPLTIALGPWPMQISQDRVTDERAAITRVLPDDPIWKTPNVIAAADFDGWVQERGLYFAGKWDEKYQAPLAANDPGEPPRQGGLLIARHGKGRFVYTGLAFFRQLPAGVPGAFRLFANLLAREPVKP